MAKGPKLQLSIFNSIQICRPKDPSLLVQNPSAKVTHLFSSINSKSFHISIPNFPDPPSSPNNSLTKHNLDSSKPHEYSKTRKAGQERKYSSTFTSDSNERAWPVSPSRIQMKKEKTTTDKQKVKLKTSPPNDEEEPLNGSKKPVKQRSVRTGRFKRYGSKDWKDASMTPLENEPHEQKPVSRRVAQHKADKRANKSFVVMKRSVDPFEDFKKSMLEMILEKQICEPKEMEQLLMSFLSLNSRLHHKVILEAFTEIWKEVFIGSPN